MILSYSIEFIISTIKILIFGLFSDSENHPKMKYETRKRFILKLNFSNILVKIPVIK